MAKIQLSLEELLHLLKGEVDFPELKKQLAKSLLDVWSSEEVRTEIEARGEELAKKKVERTIEGAFKEEVSGWGSNKTTRLSGWAVPLIREVISKATMPDILEAIRPELEKMVSELVQKEFGNLFMNLVKQQAAATHQGSKNNE